MLDCPTCSRSFAQLTPAGLCQECTEKHALPPPRAPLRPPRPCARCNGTVLVRCHVLRERSAMDEGYGNEYITPLAVTFDHRVKHTFWRGRKVSAPDAKKPIGVFEAYICRACGFTDLYTRDADKIPIGPEYGTELIELDTASPYR